MSNVSQPSRKLRGVSLESMPAEQAIPYLLKSLHHSLRQAVDEAFRRERVDMSFAHFAVLYTLDSEPGVAGAEIARRGFVTAQTMNTILRRLEQDGYIERRRHPSNPRADSWFVTKTGQSRLKRAKAIGDAIWRSMLSALKQTEVMQLQNLLERCIGGLDEQLESRRVALKPARAVRAVQRSKRAEAPQRARRS